MCGYSGYDQWFLHRLVFNPVLKAYQYYELVDLLIKKERSWIGWSLHAVLWYLQTIDEEKENEKDKYSGIWLDKGLMRSREGRSKERHKEWDL